MMDKQIEKAIYIGLIIGLVLLLSLVCYKLGGQDACKNSGGMLIEGHECLIPVDECQLREIQRSAKALSQQLPLGNWGDLGIGEDK